jgi:hypothetical protein
MGLWYRRHRFVTLKSCFSIASFRKFYQAIVFTAMSSRRRDWGIAGTRDSRTTVGNRVSIGVVGISQRCFLYCAEMKAYSTSEKATLRRDSPHRTSIPQASGPEFRRHSPCKSSPSIIREIKFLQYALYFGRGRAYYDRASTSASPDQC